MKRLDIILANRIIPLSAKNEFTLSKFERFQSGTNLESSDCVFVRDAFYQIWDRNVGGRDSHTEYSLLSYPVSDFLLRDGCCVFHSASFICNDRAFLIAGHPGIGKSTHLRGLMELEPSVEVISGDRPVLELKNQQIIVNPSPWNGKENWYGTRSAPLACIFYLTRGHESRLDRMKVKNAVIPLFNQMFQTAKNAETIELAASFLDAMLKIVPVYSLVSLHPEDSVRLLHRLISRKEYENEIQAA